MQNCLCAAVTLALLLCNNNGALYTTFPCQRQVEKLLLNERDECPDSNIMPYGGRRKNENSSACLLLITLFKNVAISVASKSTALGFLLLSSIPLFLSLSLVMSRGRKPVCRQLSILRIFQAYIQIYFYSIYYKVFERKK